MKITFAKFNIFLLTIFVLGLSIISIFMYYINFNSSFYNYFTNIYNKNLLILVDKFCIFTIGIIGSIWTYINYKRTNNIQFVFFYCFICSFILEPISILKHYLLSHALILEFHYFMKFYHLITIFSLLNLFFLSLYICNFQIKSITYTIYLIFTFSILYSSLAPINTHNQTNYLLFSTANNRFYIDLTLLLIPINILVAFSRKKNFNYLLIFISILLIVIGIYFNSIEMSYSFIPSLIGVPIYLREAGKFFFHWL